MAILFNYLYNNYFDSLIRNICELIIKIFDKFGIEVHFMRLLYQTLFDTRYSDANPFIDDSDSFLKSALFIDHLLLILIIIPLFIMALRYLTSPV
jgi:uncharacterized membrane protein (DUF373 family)